ncbi:4433_t:CDS:1, partial [Racocetra persica]
SNHQQTNIKAAQELIEHWVTMINVARNELVSAQEKQAYYANKKRHYEEFNKEDLVILNAANLPSPENSK